MTERRKSIFLPHVSRSRSKTVSPELGLGFGLTKLLLVLLLLLAALLHLLLRPKLPMLLYVGTDDLGVVESLRFEVEQDLGNAGLEELCGDAV